MHETRNFVLVLLLLAAVAWAFTVWFVVSDWPGQWTQRIVSIPVVIGLGAFLVYALKYEDKLPDHLGERIGDVYYGADGVAFMPTVRKEQGQAELCVFYQNRFENPAEVIVHLRPPEDSFIIRPNVHDVHFAFRAGGGDFGAIRQPIAVPEHLQGEVIQLHLAAGTYYPRSQGARLRKQSGITCGTLMVDWGGAAFKSGVHEVSGEIELRNPSALHLSMPTGVRSYVTGEESWRQECIAAGVTS